MFFHWTIYYLDIYIYIEGERGNESERMREMTSVSRTE
jgi:hypothetical protein